MAALFNADAGTHTSAERLAIRFVDLLATDHHAVDAAFIGELATVFTTEQIIELGWFIGQAIGTHRFMHTLDVFGEDAPVIGEIARA